MAERYRAAIIGCGGISRRHARLEFDGTRWRIIDLDSTNGTYLGGKRLLPAVPEVWQPDVSLRMGRFSLSLVKATDALAAAGPGAPARPTRESPVPRAKPR